jgi:hypothetical protein
LERPQSASSSRVAVRPVSSETPLDERTLRHPWERPVYVLSACVNILILAAAVWLVTKGTPWLDTHPVLHKRASQLRALALAGIFAVPSVVFLRNTRWARTDWNCVRLSPRQIPELYAIIARQCAVFSMPVPALYISSAEREVARAYATSHHYFIVLGTALLQPDSPIADAVAFNIAREIGRIRLKHTEWWDELLISYIMRIPVLRTPLMHLRTYSADRYGALLEPGGVRGLIALSTGRLMLPRVDVAEYLQELPSGTGLSTVLAQVAHIRPPIRQRIRALYELGLFRDSA